MLLLLALLHSSCVHPQVREWPLIKEVNVRHHFAANKTNEQEKALIYDKGGKPLYCLDARFCWRDFDDERDYYYSGTLDCRLYPVAGDFSPTVLWNTQNPTRDWQTYGRFTSEDLAGLVGADASRSIIQRCRVRGMIIEIEVLNIKGDSERIRSLDLIFTAKNSSLANERLYPNHETTAPDN
jgi:hypothetical protein